MQPVLIAAIGYLLGSIPFGFLLVQKFRGEDIRNTGSGNIGATNVSRTSPMLGLATLFLDAGKGLAAVLIAKYIFHGNEKELGLAALLAIVGHVFPLWLRFQGGKGVATGVGAFLPLAPQAVLVGAAVFVVIFVAFRYVSLASIAMFAALPVAAKAFRMPQEMSLLLASGTLLIVLKHHENIRRLWNGNETRWERG
jgi:glycerol-3-phosphate acyltransferase PlsY